MDSNLRMMPIPGFPGYLAREDGEIFTLLVCKSRGNKGGTYGEIGAIPKPMKPTLRKKDGRREFKIRAADGRKRNKFGAVLVLMAFVGERPHGHQCCHNDGDPTNDHLSNLRWDTSKGNHRDMRLHGTALIGSACRFAKLNEQKVAQILVRHDERAADLAVEFGVSDALIRTIRKGRIWKHVTPASEVSP